jgi:uncharacterized protein (TIGR01777 family)
MQVLVSGSTGLIGSEVVPRLEKAGHRVSRLVRREPEPASGEVRWNPNARSLDPGLFAGKDAVIHLAGESLASGRWTEARKQRIYDSRVRGTKLLAESMAGIPSPPGVLVSASAIGYYGDRGSETLVEDSKPGFGFLSDVCHDWEEATAAAAKTGIRVVLLRIGMVLSRSGGALAKMLPPFRMGAGGRIGAGKQYWSWIELSDLAGVFLRAIEDESLRGPVNAVAPNPVTNLEFTRALGEALGRPTYFPLPAFAARAALGQMADDLLLASSRVIPAKLTAAGYPFRFPEIGAALRHVVGG